MKCLMNAQTIEGALCPEDLERIQDYLCRADFVPVPLGDGEHMCAAFAPQWLREYLTDLVSQRVEKELSEVAIFCRYNDSEVDCSFRIHSDGEINGQQPTVAAVLYLNDGETGTALFKDRDMDVINTEDDGGWEVSHFSPQKANNLFIYDARQFHSRWPAQATEPRFAVVAFLKEKDNG